MTANQNDEIRGAIERLYELYMRIQAIPEHSVERIAQTLIANKLHDELIRLGFTEEQFRRTVTSLREATKALNDLRLAENSARVLTDRVAEPRTIDLNDHRAEAKSIIRVSVKAAGVKLSAGGRQMLTIPLVESYQLGQEWNRNEIRSSIEKIIGSLQTEEKSEHLPEKSSIDVIRGFSKNYCNIPPFCRRKAERG